MERPSDALLNGVDTYGHYADRIAAITSRPLTPENIEHYADDALADLIDVVAAATAEYDRQPTIRLYGSAREHAAFVYLGMDEPRLEKTLDHIANQAEQIHSLDMVIEAITQKVDYVITQPDTKQSFAPSAGEPPDARFEQKRTIPRLKTLLFILKNEYGIDIENPQELRCVAGPTPKGMMRKASYYTVSIPSLQRIVFVCDEAENPTYLFNAAAFEDMESLAKMSKSQKNQVVDEQPENAMRLVYTNRYVDKLSFYLGNELDMKFRLSREGKTYLLPQMKLISARAIAVELGVSDETVQQAIEKYAITSKSDYPKQRLYDEEDKRTIREHVIERGLLVEPAPDGYHSKYSLSQELFGRDARRQINRAIKALGDKLGDIKKYKFIGIVTEGFTPAQSNMIKEWLETEGYLAVESDGKTVAAIARRAGVFDRRVQRAYEMLGDAVGDVKTERRAGKVVRVYSEEQEELALAWIRANPTPKELAKIALRSHQVADLEQ